MKWLRVKYRLLRRTLATNIATNRRLTGAARRGNVGRIYWTAPALALANFVVAVRFWVHNRTITAAEITWRNGIIRANLTVAILSLVI